MSKKMWLYYAGAIVALYLGAIAVDGLGLFRPAPNPERPTWSTQELQQAHPGLQKGLPRND